MKKAMKALGLVLLLGTQISFGDQLGTGKAMRHFPGGLVEPFAPGFEVVSYAKNSGHLTLKFTITYFPDAQLQPTCDLLMMTVYPFDGLTYTGPETLLVPYKTENPYSTLMELTIPPNDTSYLIFREECDRVAYHYGITFVTTGDTLVTRWESGGRDRELAMEWTIRHWPDPREDYERAKREWEERQEQLRRFKGKSTTGHGRRLSSEDSTRLGPMRKEITLDSLHKLELEPLTDRDAQVMQVGDILYIRRKGEYKFQVAETFNSWEEYLESRQHREPDDWSREVHIVMDLRDPENYKFVSQLVDSLIPMERQGYYHTVTTLRVIDEIRTRHIDYVRYPRYPGESGPPPKPGRKNEKSSRIDCPPVRGDRNSWDLLFYDGFEGTFPGPWSTLDYNPDNGEDYWGKLDTSVCTPSAGVWAVWCSGVGDMIPGSWYDNDMFSDMRMTNGVDISNYTAIEVTFDVLYDTEDGYDYMEVEMLVGDQWYDLGLFTGWGWYWSTQTYTLAVNAPQVKLFFWFTSDKSTVGPGIYLDEIYIYGDVKYPDLTWDVPSGWPLPIVPSPVPFTNSLDNLYAGEATYIDCAIYNWSDMGTGSFHVALYLDDSLLQEQPVYGLGPYETLEFYDLQTTVAIGYHNLRLWVDNRNEVQEWSEANNTYDWDFEWLQPEITYTGYVYYWDMNPPASTELARNVTIKMWDKDGSGQQLLDTARTDQYGYFQLGPVTNNNDTQDKDGVQQDIFFSVHSYYYDSLCYVIKSIGDVYQHSTSAFYNHRSGVFDTTIQIPADSSGAFFVFDVILAGHDTCYNT